MLEGLAVWALFIYLLRMIGMPWNTYTKSFAYLGGSGWLLFVWVGLLNYTPMDMSGGSVVQAPHVQLRPGNTAIKGKVKALHVAPNDYVTQGQLIYELDDEPYRIAVERSEANLASEQVALKMAGEEVAISQAQHQEAVKDIEIIDNELKAADEDLNWKQAQLTRFIEQNRVVPQSVTESLLDEQHNKVAAAQAQQVALQAKLAKARVSADKALLAVDQAQLSVASAQADVDVAIQTLAQDRWNLESTKVYAPDDGFMTNFILRPGQYVGAVARINMFTDEKYVLMRINHQAMRNIKVGQTAEFASAIYPGTIFKAEVTGIVKATGESQGNLIGREEAVRQTTGANVQNKHHFVRLKIEEPEGYTVPVGSVGLAWISGEKPIAFMSFLDVIRGIIIRMKSQIYYFYSL
ncbi:MULTISPECIES: HlyD family secretion protein [Ferrimonas]|uniref:HlyD family secretion protein n=1 Tax=Ferrimonas TaxID=44011 RepID=UPI00040EC694|nr:MULTISPECIES: efflux RND transporter periplasmic adaptor subunit [Ferrimonas]USD39041.1 efflux RND transporter periplasmic adaptor subunit [Ferrimonas sp. SCSIO 43195]